MHSLICTRTHASTTYPVTLGCRIYLLILCIGVRFPTNVCPIYDTKQSDGEAPVILELWGKRITPSLPSLPGPNYNTVLTMSQIELNCVLMLN